MLPQLTVPVVYSCYVTTMAPHYSTLAWKIPWTEEQSLWSRRVWHDWETSLSLFTFMHWRRKCQPTPVLLPVESQGWGSQVGCSLWGCRVRHDWSDLAAAAALSMYYPTCISPLLKPNNNHMLCNYWTLSVTHISSPLRPLSRTPLIQLMNLHSGACFLSLLCLCLRADVLFYFAK